MISSKAVERIRGVTSSLLRATSQQSKNQVSNILNSYGIDINSMPELEAAFSPSVWEHGSSELNDQGDFSAYFPNISPREVVLGKKRKWKRLKNGKSRVVEYPERYYYLSLIASLEVLLHNQKILDMVASPREQDLHSSLLCDFSDGTLVQDHELFSVDPQSLKIVLYYDDLEITNDRTKRKHKLSMFYY